MASVDGEGTKLNIHDDPPENVHQKPKLPGSEAFLRSLLLPTLSSISRIQESLIKFVHFHCLIRYHGFASGHCRQLVFWVTVFKQRGSRDVNAVVVTIKPQAT